MNPVTLGVVWGALQSIAVEIGTTVHRTAYSEQAREGQDFSVAVFDARGRMVMGPATPGSSVKFRVLIDGRPPGAAHRTDVDEQGNGTVPEQRLYQLIRQPGTIDDRQFEIEFLDPGVEAFVFTFG